MRSVILLPLLFFVALLIFTAPKGARASDCPNVEGAEKFFKTVRSKIHKRIKEKQLESYNCIFKFWNDNKFKDKRWLSYILATAYHESHMAPVREGFGGHRKGVAAGRHAWKMGWPKRPYHLKHPKTGKVYYGRGLVQITYAENYLRVGRAIGLGDRLYKNPDLALQPKIATKLMFHGMQKGLYRVEKRKSIMRKCGGPVKKYVRAKLGLYFNARCAEWHRARNMINGDVRKNGGKIKRMALHYRGGLSPIPTSIKDEPFVITEPEIKPSLPGNDGEPGGAPVDKTPVTPETDVVTAPPTTPTDKVNSDEKIITPELPGDEPKDGETDPGSDVIVEPVDPPVTPPREAEMAALKVLEDQSARQEKQISAMENALKAQKKIGEDNSVALANVDNKLRSIERKLDGLSARLAAVSPGVNTPIEERPVTTPPVKVEPEKPKGWFGRTFDSVKGYVWTK